MQVYVILRLLFLRVFQKGDHRNFYGILNFGLVSKSRSQKSNKSTDKSEVNL